MKPLRLEVELTQREADELLRNGIGGRTDEGRAIQRRELQSARDKIHDALVRASRA